MEKSEKWRGAVPVPVYDDKPEYIELYWKAWELAWDHVKEIPGMPQTPYMDEAFIPTDIWIWDTCFMTFFCRYAPEVFPGIESLNNFYQPFYDDRALPVIEIRESLPDFPELKVGEKRQLVIHISDNPPLFAWAEYVYARMTGDSAHLKELLLEHQYLQKHFRWMESLTEQIRLKPCRNLSCLIRRPDGFLWEGGRSGMDNTPRGRVGGKAGDIARPNHPEMLWVDAIAQQALSAQMISRCAALIHEDGLVAEWDGIYREYKEKINRLYWDKEDGMYYDIHERTREFMKCLTPASFWPMLAEIPSEEQAAEMVKVLEDPSKLGGEVPVLSLARDDADFHPVTGEYWRGALWLPTAYMTLKALEKYGYTELAHGCACRILDHMHRTYREFEPHTIWECYAPNSPEPAHHGDQWVRPDFCGWSALGPIALFIENVIGIDSVDAFRNLVCWHLPKERRGRIGIRGLSFGKTKADLLVEGDECTAVSSRPFALEIDGVRYEVPAGKAVLKLKTASAC